MVLPTTAILIASPSHPPATLIASSTVFSKLSKFFVRLPFKLVSIIISDQPDEELQHEDRY
jgi:hypothetical protein